MRRHKKQTLRIPERQVLPSLPAIKPPIDISQRVVIMAAGQAKRWHNHLGIPKQLAPVNGEPVIKRTIRLLKERGITDIWVTVNKAGQYGDLGVREYIPQNNITSIDRIYASRELAPAIWLYGDAYYTEATLDIILSDTHNFRFFGRAKEGKIKTNREMYAIKANDWVIEQAAQLRKMLLEGEIINAIGQTLHYVCEGEEFNTQRKRFTIAGQPLREPANMRWKYYTEITDETDDFDNPSQYRKLLRLVENRKPPKEKIDTSGLTCAFIMRCHYKEGDPRFEWRLKYFKDEVLPRIWAQTEKGFDVCVRCNPIHDDIFRGLGCKPFHVKNEYADYVLSAKGNKKYFYDFVKWEDCLDLEQYDIQIGLDTDDLIAPNYVETIKRLCVKSGTSLHIHFQPEYYMLETRRVKRHPVRYGNQNSSMFFALYYPDKSKYHHAYEISHRQLTGLVEKSILMPSGYCWMTIHKLNESSGRTFTKEELEGVKAWNPGMWFGK